MFYCVPGVTKEMKRLLARSSLFAGSYLVVAIVLEMITFACMGLGVLPTYFGLDFAVILIIALCIFVIPNAAAQISVLSFFLLLQIVLSIANEALYSMSGMVFSFSMLNLVSEVTGVVDASFLNWWLIVGSVLLFGGTLAGLIVFTRKYAVPKGLYTRNAVIIMLVAFIIAECCAGIIYALTVESFSAAADQNTSGGDRLSIFYDESELYEEQKFTAKAFKEFGTYGYFVVNIGNTISGITYVDEVDTDAIDDYFREGEMSKSVYGDDIYTGAIDGKNIVLIVIESGEWYVINKEYTPTLYAMAEGGVAMTDFHARDKTNCSEALSIMGSYPSVTNLEPAKIKGTEIPYTFANILSESGYTTNYFHINTGSYYDRNQVFNGMYGYQYTHFLEDLPMLPGYTHKDGFNDLDKDSNVFRWYADEFTKTDGGPFFTQMMTLVSHGSYKDLIDLGNYPFATTPSAKGEVSTGEMSEAEKEKFSEKCLVKDMEEYYCLIDRFPQTFVSGTDGIAEDYLTEQGRYEEMFLRYKRYQAGIMDLDLGVNMLVKDLQEQGKLDDTVFMFYADHSAYYDQMNYLMKGIDPSEFYNTNVYDVPCFIWYGGSMDLKVEPLALEEYSAIDFTATKDTSSPLQAGTKIDKFCNTYDILPTLLHLSGYSYNTKLYHGVSIFSKLESIFVSHESGIFIDDVYFSTIDVYIENGNMWMQYPFTETYETGGFGQYVLNFLYKAADYYDDQTMRDAVLKTNYFASRDFYEGYNGITYIEKVD